MRKSRFTEAQIIGMIKEQEAGLPTAGLCRKHGLSPVTFYNLKAKYGGMELSDAKPLKQLEDENANPRTLVMTEGRLGAGQRFVSSSAPFVNFISAVAMLASLQLSMQLQGDQHRV